MIGASAELPVDPSVFAARQPRQHRLAAARTGADAGNPGVMTLDAQLASMSSAVISRVKAERAQSLPSRIARLFEDLHLVWAALAATTATATAAAIVAGVLYFAPKERSDSLAGVLSALAAPGSDRSAGGIAGHAADPAAFSIAMECESRRQRGGGAWRGRDLRRGRSGEQRGTCRERDQAELHCLRGWKGAAAASTAPKSAAMIKAEIVASGGRRQTGAVDAVRIDGAGLGNVRGIAFCARPSGCRHRA